MGENEWLNGYLEAILDVGSGRNGDANKSGRNKKSVRMKADDEMVGLEKDKAFSPRKYFVEEVVNSFDEADLHRTWIKVHT